MPELPEVETVVRGLRARLVGRRVESVWWSGKALRLGRPLALRLLRALLVGRRVTALRRRAKYILADVEGGAGLLVHLGMTGRLRLQPAGDARAPHTHVVFALDDGRQLRFVDARRFGQVLATRAWGRLPELRHLGPDPLTELDEARLGTALAESRAPLKAFLLDQRRIAGLGNIYVSEALFRARLHPRTIARQARPHAGALLDGIRAALQAGLDRGGTTFRDYVDADGKAGEGVFELQVYGRHGEPCLHCATPIRRTVDAGRATFHCPTCQKALRRRA